MKIVQPLAPGELRAEVVAIDGSVHIVVAGELDLHTGVVFWEACLSAADQVPPGGELVVDLCALNFLGAAGIGSLVRLGKLLGGAGKRLQVKADCPTIRRVFQITQLDRLLSAPVISEMPMRPQAG